MSSYAAAVSLSLVLFFAAVDGQSAGFGGEPYAIRDAKTRIVDRVESTIQCYLRSAVNLDVNFMLGVSIMKGQFMSCTDRFGFNYFNGFDQKSRLATMVDGLYEKFYENNTMDLETTWRMLDAGLWTSARRAGGRKPVGRARLPAGFDAGALAAGDQYFRGVSDECLRLAVVTCRMAAQCTGPELSDDFHGYARTHQVLYMHVLKNMDCSNPVFRTVAGTIVHDKCNEIFAEAQYIADDPDTLDMFIDLFVEQIAVCGMQNAEDFIRLDWLSIVLSAVNDDCGNVQCKNNNNNHSPRDSSHLAGVSLAALGTYWKFFCYYGNDNAK